MIAVLLFTSASSFAADNKFYLKTALGLSVFKEHKINNMNLGLFVGESKHRSASGANLEFAGGYYINDTFRTDLGISIYNIGELESKFKFKSSGIIGWYKVKKTTKISSMMIGAYVNFFNWKDFKFFIGGKIGAAQIKETNKLSGDFRYLGIPVKRLNSFVTKKSKNSNNVAYALSLGASIPISDAITLDSSIGYTDLGKSKSCTYLTNEVGKTRYRNVNLEMGLRFNI